MTILKITATLFQQLCFTKFNDSKLVQYLLLCMDEHVEPMADQNESGLIFVRTKKNIYNPQCSVGTHPVSFSFSRSRFPMLSVQTRYSVLTRILYYIIYVLYIYTRGRIYAASIIVFEPAAFTRSKNLATPRLLTKIPSLSNILAIVGGR